MWYKTRRFGGSNPSLSLRTFHKETHPKESQGTIDHEFDTISFVANLLFMETVHDIHYTPSKLHFETKVQIGVSKYLLPVFQKCKIGGSLVATTCGVSKHFIFTVMGLLIICIYVHCFIEKY